MKKILLLFSAMIAVTVSLFANPVNQKFAKEIATAYYQHYAPAQITDYSVKEAFATQYEGTTAFYTFKFNAGGWVMVSADDAVIPILGYSYTSDISENIENPSTKDWIDGYSKEICNAITAKLPNTETIKIWNNIKAGNFEKATLDVSPLLTTTWDQGCYYNALCPAASGGQCGHVWTGCVATAMSQIMKYWNFPAQGVGSHSYVHALYGLQSADFGATTYNWASMPNNVTSTNTAVATLMYHAGVSVDMNYAVAGSGAYSTDVPYALSTYFNYDPTVQYKAQADYPNVETWKALIRTELDNSRPVYYSGQSTASGGHAFVCDGYRTSDSKFHFNWGWSGYADGYFAIGALNPAGSNFNDNNAIVIGIKPGNANLICRINSPENGTTFSPNSTIPIAASVSTGTPTSFKLYIDGVEKTSVTGTTINYDWNTAGVVLGPHTLKVVATDANNTVYHQVSVNISAWQMQNTGFTTASRGIDQICIVNENTVWAKAYDGVTPTNYIREFAKTIDGGTTWTHGTINFSGASAFGVSNMFAMSATKAYACMFPKSGTGGKIVVTNDGGATWTVQSTANFTNSWADWVHFFDSQNGVCMGDSYQNKFFIFTTTDGGTTWVRVPDANVPPASASEAGTVNMYDASGDNIWFGTSTGRVYKSTNKGLNWTVSETNMGAIQADVRFKDANTGFVYGSNTGITWAIKKTTDGGATWNTINPAGAFMQQHIAYVPGTPAQWMNVSADYQSTTLGDGSAKSINDLASLTRLDTAIQYTTVRFFDINTGWAGGFNTSATEGGIYKWVGVDPQDTAVNFSVSANTITVGDTVHFNDISNFNPTAWSWSFPGGTPATSTEQFPQVQYATIGIYPVTLTANYGNVPYSITKNFYINVTAPQGSTVSGLITYPNTAATPLSNVVLTLKNNGTSVGTFTTGTDGTYHFDAVPNGDYTLEATTTKAWGGVTAGDVLLYKKHIAGISTLTGIFLNSGDVNGSGGLTASDVLLVKKRIASIISSFTVGDWLFNNTAITVNGANVTMNFNGLCYGDANASFTPAAKSLAGDSPLKGINAGNLTIQAVDAQKGELIVPVYASDIQNMGSFQFTITYDASKLTFINADNWYTGIKDVTFASPVAGKITFVWAADDNSVSIANDKLFDLHFTSSSADASSSVEWSDTPTAREFGDWDGNIFEPAYANGSVGAVTGMSELNDNQLMIYPNPAHDFVTIKTNNDIQSVKVLNYTGQVVLNTKTNGNEVNINTSDLKAGIYFIQIETKTNKFTRSISIK